MFLCCFYCLISFLQLAAFCQQFIKEMCYVCYVCYVKSCPWTLHVDHRSMSDEVAGGCWVCRWHRFSMQETEVIARHRTKTAIISVYQRQQSYGSSRNSSRSRPGTRTPQFTLSAQCVSSAAWGVRLFNTESVVSFGCRADIRCHAHAVVHWRSRVYNWLLTDSTIFNQLKHIQATVGRLLVTTKKLSEFHEGTNEEVSNRTELQKTKTHKTIL